MRKNKICFTIMGFGRKTDYSNGKTYDLDKTYQNIIKPAVEACGYTSVRADEIQSSGLIDKSMYALLVHADLVIADITTFNPNALYELGVRHAARPNHTIILKDKDGAIPFDLNHSKFLIYTHLGEDVGATEAQECQVKIKALVKAIEGQENTVDSPLFEYISGLQPHKLTDVDYKQIVEMLSSREGRVSDISNRAKQFIESGNFAEAAKLWEQLCISIPEESFFVQQYAFCTYKAEAPSKLTSFTKALSIISKISNETNDPETLGLTGAIYKGLFECANDIESLRLAIDFYRRGYVVSNNHYTGENYATCLDLLAGLINDSEEIAWCRVDAVKTRKVIINNLLADIASDVDGIDKKWVYATLSNCYYNTGDVVNGALYENLFIGEKPCKWEYSTFMKHRPVLHEEIAIYPD